MEPNKREKALSVLRAAVQEQQRLHNSVIPGEMVERSVPILWFGQPKKGNWVTIATNPSGNEFLQGNVLREGKKARVYHLPPGQSLDDYLNREKGLEQTIESYLCYYQNKPYGQWFGARRGGRLEGFLNGLGGSLYGGSDLHPVVHTDFVPFATKKQFSALTKNNQTLERELTGSSFAKDFLHETLQLLEPSLIILLGPKNYNRYLKVDPTSIFKSSGSVSGFPEVKFEIGWSPKYRADVLGLRFKPSEQMIGLGSKVYGSYQTTLALRKMGEYIRNQLPMNLLTK